MNFGTVVVGQKKYVSARGNPTTVSTGAVIDNGNGGEFTVLAQAGSDVTISLVLPISLTGSVSGSLPILFGSGEDTDIYTDIFVIKNVELGYYDMIELNFPNKNYSSFPTSDLGGGINGVKVQLGGTVDAAGVTAGTYSGTITLSATYN